MLTKRLLVLFVAVVGLFASEAQAVYDAGTGRWLQRDPVGYVDGSNRYQYVRSSPVRYTDSTGLLITGPDLITPIFDLPFKEAIGAAGGAYHKWREWNAFKKDYPNTAAAMQGLSMAEKGCLQRARNSAIDQYHDVDLNVAPGGSKKVGRGKFRGTIVDGPGDAARHCMWHCLMASCVGASRAKQIGDGYEKDQPGSNEQNEMDRHNNDVGAKLWAQILNNNRNAGRSDRHNAAGACAQSCEDQLSKGCLKVLPRDQWRDHNDDPEPDPNAWPPDAWP